MRRAPFATLFIGFFTACASQDESTFLSGPSQNVQLVELADRVAFVDSRQERIFFLDPADPDLKPRIVSTGHLPVQMEQSKGSPGLLVLTAGRTENLEKQAEPSRLTRYPAAGTEAPKTLDLPGRFHRFVQSEDGRFAVLHYVENAKFGVETGLYNPSSIALVDWSKEDAVRFRSIRSLGGRPTDVVFAPRALLFGRERTLAVVLSSNYVTLLEVDAPTGGAEKTEITIPLTPDGQRKVNPKQILFDMQRPAIFIRAEGSNDIFQITLDAQTSSDSTNSNDFRASLSMVAAGTSPTDMAFFGEDGSKKLLIASPGKQQIVVIDPKTGQSTLVASPVAADRVYVFRGKSPRDPAIEDRALLVAKASGSPMVVFADLAMLEIAPSLALESWSIQTAVGDVTRISSSLALLLPAKTISPSGLTLVNLEERTFPPIEVGGKLAATLVETGNQNRLWVIEGEKSIGYLDLVDLGGARFASGEVLLDQSIERLIPLAEKSSDGHRYLLVEHQEGRELGNITVLDAEKPTRSGARSARGFLLTDYLERGQP